MNVLLLGGGGREHALAFALSKSPLLTKLFVAPGNPGTEAIAETVKLDVANHAALVDFCRLMTVGFVVVGPEAPLVAGVVDSLGAAGIPAFGPTMAAARLEGSKAFTKTLCSEVGIPTAAWRRFDAEAPARAYVREQGAPIVVKYDGLMAGKGVTVAETVDAAEAALAAIYAGEPAAAVVIEECMQGEEVSFFCLSDGASVLPFGSAQDHKRAFDGDEGPNTGGMGAYSPAPVFTSEMESRALDEIVRPTVRALAERGTPYRGVLFAGLMITREGPKLIEYNARFGDPECQVLMLRLESDLLPLLMACAKGDLGERRATFSPAHAIAVVMAADGYPGKPVEGTPMRGLDEAGALPGVTLFHAGTRRQGDGIVAGGGRVLNVCATGGSIAEARWRAYAAIDRIDWPGGFCRRDIAWRAL